MENYILPHHQFEIRFTPMLNFNSFAKTLLAPYIQRTISFGVENDGTKDERITLNFDEGELYTIFVSWDRMVFKSTVGIKKLDEPNSLFEEPFLAIYEKIKKHESFGTTFQSAYYNVGIIPKNETFEDQVKYVKEKYLNSKAVDSLLTNAKDVGVMMESSSNGYTEVFEFGPYSGMADFQKKGIQLSLRQQSTLVDKRGLYFTYQGLNLGKTIDMKIYQRNNKSFETLIEKI